MPITSAKTSITKSLPASEKKVVVCFTGQNDSGDKYYITHNQTKNNFTLWKCLEDGLEKISTSSNPVDFDEIIPYGK